MHIYISCIVPSCIPRIRLAENMSQGRKKIEGLLSLSFVHAQFEIRFFGRFVSWFQRVDPVWLLLARYDWYSPCVVICLPILMTNGIAYYFIENTDIANNKKHYPLPPPRWKGRNNRIIPSYQNKIDGMKKKARIHDIFTISAILQVLDHFEPIWLLWTTITSNTIPT